MAYNTIKIKKYLDIIVEKVANAAITPGMLVEEMSTGKVRAHATSEGNVLPIFALEDELQGKGIDGNNIAIGDWLASNGDGYLKEHVAETESWAVSEAGEVTVLPLAIVAQAIEAVDTSDSSGGESSATLGYARRCRVRIV